MSAITTLPATTSPAAIPGDAIANYTEQEIAYLSQLEGYLEYENTIVLKYLLNSPCKITAIFCGNQFGKGETVVMDYWYRMMGIHPQKHKNFTPDKKVRMVRFASENLPGEAQETETSNTQYPILKRRFLQQWIKKDITARKSVVTCLPECLDANGKKGKPIQFQFSSYGQTSQSQAGIQLLSCWIDESAPKDFFQEQIPRLLAADGDLIMTFTPVPGSIGWEFDELFERAKVIYRTPYVRDRIFARTGERIPLLEYTNSEDDICVIMAATNDNPIYGKLAAEKSKRTGKVVTKDEYVAEMFAIYDDEDVIDARQFGIFRQLSGKIFKSFLERTHVISADRYFPDGVPYTWKHFRGIDWHETTPWACGWIAVSPQDEIFVYNEFNPSPERLITAEIMRVVASRSQDYRFELNLVDPLASKIQPNTGISSLEDMNRIMAAYRKEGLGTGGYWTVWDTKSQKGRDEIRKRLMNAAKVGHPFANEVQIEGHKQYLPTIWVLDNCKQTIQSLKNWRREEWAGRSGSVGKEEKETPQQKWSHFCTMLEGLLKRQEVFQARFQSGNQRPKIPKYR